MGDLKKYSSKYKKIQENDLDGYFTTSSSDQEKYRQKQGRIAQKQSDLIIELIPIINKDLTRIAKQINWVGCVKSISPEAMSLLRDLRDRLNNIVKTANVVSRM